jgi:epsilon-lactone hydrolase
MGWKLVAGTNFDFGGEMNYLRLVLFVALVPGIPAQQAPTSDTTVIDKDGTARITRVVGVPKTISPEAQAHLATGETWAPATGSAFQKAQIEKARSLYPVQIEEKTIAGVPVKIFTPDSGVPGSKQDRVLINLHGGGFVSDSGSDLESIPIANLAATRVVSVLYRLAPQNLFPAGVDDVVAVYRELLKSYRPAKMVMYGTSAGASLTAQVAVRLRKEGLPLPVALGFFTGNPDLSQPGDTQSLFAVPGLSGAQIPEPGRYKNYLGAHDPKDPLASPIYADLKGFPPTLCMSGTRDHLLSGTANFHRALLRAGVDAQLVVFEALPHAFWYMVQIPEAQEALKIQADFFDRHLR